MTKIYYLISRIDPNVGIWRIFFKGSFAECKEKKMQLWKTNNDDNSILRNNAKIVTEKEAITKYLGFEIRFNDLFS